MKNKDELLIAYFENQLTENQQIEFQKLLENDADFLTEFNFQKNLKSAITKGERSRLKAKLNTIDLTSSKPKARLSKIYYIAASVILFFGLLGVWINNSGSDYQKLYSQNYEQFPNIMYPNVRSSQDKNPIIDAFSAYDKGDYKNAIQLFSISNDNEARFYQGLSEMQLGDFKKALYQFDKIETSKINFNNHLHWYKALCFLKLEDVESCRNNLILIKEDPLYKDKVSELLSALD